MIRKMQGPPTIQAEKIGTAWWDGTKYILIYPDGHKEDVRGGQLNNYINKHMKELFLKNFKDKDSNKAP